MTYTRQILGLLPSVAPQRSVGERKRARRPNLEAAPTEAPPKRVLPAVLLVEGPMAYHTTRPKSLLLPAVLNQPCWRGMKSLRPQRKHARGSTLA